MDRRGQRSAGTSYRSSRVAALGAFVGDHISFEIGHRAWSGPASPAAPGQSPPARRSTGAGARSPNRGGLRLEMLAQEGKRGLHGWIDVTVLVVEVDVASPPHTLHLTLRIDHARDLIAHSGREEGLATRTP
jgi:hypothetical protein